MLATETEPAGELGYHRPGKRLQGGNAPVYVVCTKSRVEHDAAFSGSPLSPGDSNILEPFLRPGLSDREAWRQGSAMVTQLAISPGRRPCGITFPVKTTSPFTRWKPSASSRLGAASMV
jgi:hypothetical protein